VRTFTPNNPQGKTLMIYSSAAKPASVVGAGFAAFEWPWISLTITATVVVCAVIVRLIFKARGR
jgi:hypothetical protein